jgi:TRAP-type C4-dicarboxylate transport system permease small subunit
VSATPAGHPLRAWRRRLIRAIEACVIVTFVTFTLTTLVAVFNRFVLNYSLVEAEELIRYSLVWMTMLAAPLVTEEDGHLNGSFMGFVKAPLARGIERAAVYAGTGLFGILLASSAWQLIGQTIETSPALGVNMGVAYAAMFVGGVLELLMVVLLVLDRAPRGAKVDYFE